MPGSPEGGRKATETLIKKFDGDVEAYKAWRRHIGSLGGKNGHTGGFAAEKVGKDGLTGPQRASIAGARGGRAKRVKTK